MWNTPPHIWFGRKILHCQLKYTDSTGFWKQYAVILMILRGEGKQLSIVEFCGVVLCSTGFSGSCKRWYIGSIESPSWLIYRFYTSIELYIAFFRDYKISTKYYQNQNNYFYDVWMVVGRFPLGRTFKPSKYARFEKETTIQTFYFLNNPKLSVNDWFDQCWWFTTLVRPRSDLLTYQIWQHKHKMICPSLQFSEFQHQNFYFFNSSWAVPPGHIRR